MAKRGGKRHMKRISAPGFMRLKKKEHKLVIKPSPGPHPSDRSVAIRVLLRDILGVAGNSREVRRILNNSDIKIDGKIVRREEFPVGLMDIVEIAKIGKTYRIMIDAKGRIHPAEIEKPKGKLCRVERKQTVRQGKTQVTFHDGRNMLTDNKIRIGDSALLKVPKQEIVKIYKLEPNSRCLIIKGKHSGEIAELKEIYPGTATRDSEVKLQNENGEFITVKKYLFVVGDVL